MDPNEEADDRRHKFSVNRVDTEDQRNDADLGQNSPSSPGFRDGRVSPNSPLHSELTVGGTSLTYSTFRSLRHLTREALPRLDHYRNLASIMKNPGTGGQRPTLDDLHQPPIDKQILMKDDMQSEEPQAGDKFGWVKGVLVRCLLNIWGVILFLRLSWVTGQAGIIEGVIICCIGNVVTTITALSMSAISTNGQIKGGGTYYMISRSLGPEFGGAIGLIFALANAIAASMYIVGFCESVNDLLNSLGTQIIDNNVNDVRIIGTITLIVLFSICIIGMEWEARAQVVLLFVLLVAMFNFVIGAFIGPLNDEEVAKGFIGLNGSLFVDNLYSDYRIDPVSGVRLSFFGVFSVFFPACTGILAGANISGDLKDPCSAIPKGTLLAIFITFISYLLFIFLAGSVELRDATGNVTHVADWSFMDCNETVCKYGLMNSSQVMELIAVFGPLIYAGCFAATLSSALASLVSAPKVFQALCRDKLYPYIEFFGKGYGKSDEPYRGYGLTFIIILIFTLIARLDAIAPIITNFFLAAYALINFSTFHASLQKIPGWRPTFKYYSQWLSLVGGVLCTAIMFLIQWWTALLTFVIIMLLYIIVKYRKPDVNWGSSTQAQIYTLALNTVTSLSSIEDHVKTYRPQILVLCGSPGCRPPLIHFANSITKNMSLLVAGECLPEQQPMRVRAHLAKEAVHWLSRHKIRAFYAISDGPNMELAARGLMANVGLGKLQPNMVLMGYKADWQSCPAQELHSYFKTIHYAFDMHYAVGILRVDGGLDYSTIVETLHNKAEDNKEPSISRCNTDPEIADGPTTSQTIQAISYQQSSTGTTPTTSPIEDNSAGFGLGLKKKKKGQEYQSTGGDPVAPQIIDAMLRFTRKQPKGTIDVWWLFDDGGLTLLIPYILTTRTIWSQCSLRVFCLANKKDDLASEHRKMAELLCKFRIDYSDVVMIPDVTKKPREESLRDFSNLISKFELIPEDSNEEEPSNGISESELLALREKTNRHIRLRELLLQHSKQASLVVMTLPMPVVGTVSAPLYVAWLETLTKDMPPFLLLRGNQSSVLTFYS